MRRAPERADALLLTNKPKPLRSRVADLLLLLATPVALALTSCEDAEGISSSAYLPVGFDVDVFVAFHWSPGQR